MILQQNQKKEDKKDNPKSFMDDLDDLINGGSSAFDKIIEKEEKEKETKKKLDEERRKEEEKKRKEAERKENQTKRKLQNRVNRMNGVENEMMNDQLLNIIFEQAAFEANLDFGLTIEVNGELVFRGGNQVNYQNELNREQNRNN